MFHPQQWRYEIVSVFYSFLLFCSLKWEQIFRFKVVWTVSFLVHSFSSLAAAMPASDLEHAFLHSFDRVICFSYEGSVGVWFIFQTFPSLKCFNHILANAPPSLNITLEPASPGSVELSSSI